MNNIEYATLFARLKDYIGSHFGGDEVAHFRLLEGLKRNLKCDNSVILWNWGPEYLSSDTVSSVCQMIPDLNIEPRRLYIGGLDIRRLPTSIYDMESLVALDIEQCHQVILPSTAQCVLPNLRRLIIRGCRLEQLPSFIGRLTRLEHLILEDNKLTFIDPSIGDLPCLLSVVGPWVTTMAVSSRCGSGRKSTPWPITFSWELLAAHISTISG